VCVCVCARARVCVCVFVCVYIVVVVCKSYQDVVNLVCVKNEIQFTYVFEYLQICKKDMRECGRRVRNEVARCWNQRGA
jgi:hypothetical protein